jgi:tetratricopeptide (TPR) repeat protein
MIERLLAAEAALDRGDVDLAHGLYTQVAGADPRNAIAVVGLARVAQRRAQPREARDLAQRALAIDHDEAAAWRLLGELADELEAGHRHQAPRSGLQSGWRRWLARFLRRG